MTQQRFKRKEAAALLGISLVTLWRMEKRGDISPSIRVSARAEYTIADLDKAISQKEKNKKNFGHAE